MRWFDRFGGSLLFAVLVSGGYPFYLAINQHVFGHQMAFAIYLLGSAAIYLLGIARRPVQGLGAALAIVLSGSFMIAIGATATQLGLVTAVLLGVLRSGVLHPLPERPAGSFPRSFAREFAFVAAGLALAITLARGGLHPDAFAFWGFYLVQSGFFLLGGDASRARTRPVAAIEPDPFARAVKRAREVLARDGSATSPH